MLVSCSYQCIIHGIALPNFLHLSLLTSSSCKLLVFFLMLILHFRTKNFITFLVVLPTLILAFTVPTDDVKFQHLFFWCLVVIYVWGWRREWVVG